MWRLISLGLIAYLIYIVFIHRNKKIEKSINEKKTTNQTSENEKYTESMVQCSTCSVHLPRSEAYLVNGKFYCTESHIPN